MDEHPNARSGIEAMEKGDMAAFAPTRQSAGQGVKSDRTQRGQGTASATEPADRPVHVRRWDRGDPRTDYEIGICLLGSTNGIATTSADRGPHSVSTETVVPSSVSPTGSQQ
jgi:hypothetical protein